jgi:hypothetical protein
MRLPEIWAHTQVRPYSKQSFQESGERIFGVTNMRLLFLCILFLCIFGGCESSSAYRKAEPAKPAGDQQVTVGGEVQIRMQHLDAH